MKSFSWTTWKSDADRDEAEEDFVWLEKTNLLLILFQPAQRASADKDMTSPPRFLLSISLCLQMGFLINWPSLSRLMQSNRRILNMCMMNSGRWVTTCNEWPIKSGMFCWWRRAVVVLNPFAKIESSEDGGRRERKKLTMEGGKSNWEQKVELSSWTTAAIKWKKQTRERGKTRCCKYKHQVGFARKKSWHRSENKLDVEKAFADWFVLRGDVVTFAVVPINSKNLETWVQS